MGDLIPGIQFTDTEKQVYGSLASAIIGALIAFGLVIVRERVGRIRRRKALHYTTLVKLNRVLSLHANRIKENIFILPKAAESLREGHVYFNILRPIDINTDMLVDLHNLRLENALMTYFDALAKDNDDINNLQTAMDLLKNALLNDTLSEENYHENGKYLAEKLELLSNRMKTGTLLMNAHALATVNDLIDRDETVGMKIDHWLVGQKKFDTTEIKKASDKIYKRYTKDINKREKNHKEDTASKED